MTLNTIQAPQFLDLRDDTVLLTLAEFAVFAMVVLVLLSLIPKSGPKHYRAIVGTFLILWAVIIEEFLGMILAVYTVGAGLFILHLIPLVNAYTVHIFTVALAFIPGLLFVNLVLYIIYNTIMRKAKEREALEPNPVGPTIEEVLT